MLFPPLDDAQGWPALHAQPLEVWTPGLAALSAAWGLRGEWERLPGGEDSVVFAQGETVVKLVPPCFAADAEREVGLLRRVRLPVSVPRVEDVRREEAWTAVRMTRLAGVPADRAWAHIPHADRRGILATVGAALRAVWATPLAPGDGDPPGLHARLVAGASRQRKVGFPAPEDFVRRHLPDPLPAPALLHMDLNDGNLMLEQRAGRWEVAGVLDFVASSSYYAPFDLVTPGVFFCRGEPDLLRALLDGAGASDLGPTELAAWHLLHPFSDLPRDLSMAGRGDRAPSEAALISLWSAR